MKRLIFVIAFACFNLGSGDVFKLPPAPKPYNEKLAMPGSVGPGSDEIEAFRPYLQTYAFGFDLMTIGVEYTPTYQIEGVVNLSELIRHKLSRLGIKTIDMVRDPKATPSFVLRGTIHDFTKSAVSLRSDFSMRLLAEINQVIQLVPSVDVVRGCDNGHVGFQLEVFELDANGIGITSIPRGSSRSVSTTETTTRGTRIGLIGFGSGITYGRNATRITSVHEAIDLMVSRCVIVSLSRVYGIPYWRILECSISSELKHPDTLVAEGYLDSHNTVKRVLENRMDLFNDWYKGVEMMAKTGKTFNRQIPDAVEYINRLGLQKISFARSDNEAPAKVGALAVCFTGFRQKDSRFIESILETLPGTPLVSPQGGTRFIVDWPNSNRKPGSKRIVAHINEHLSKGAYAAEVIVVGETLFQVRDKLGTF